MVVVMVYLEVLNKVRILVELLKKMKTKKKRKRKKKRRMMYLFY
jgi:hypothetical protein